MPRKTKTGRVAEVRKPLVKAAPPLAATPVVLTSKRRPPIKATTPAPRTAPVATSQPAEIARSLPVTDAIEMPGQRLFWAWYGAGVDTIRFAFDVQSAFVKQVFETSPASLAAHVHAAFHDRALV